MEFFLRILIKLLVLFTAFPVHEYAHTWAADKLGDHTAKYQGRLTLNPKAHIDLWGAIWMVLVGFGWGKAVPINPNNFKNPKLGMALSSFAGPASNFIMAYVAMIIYKIVFYTMGYSILCSVFYLIIVLNIGLAVFNLIPIPPLDGSRIATIFMSERTYFKIMEYERYIFIGVIIIVYSGILDAPLSFLEGIAFNAMNFLTGYIDLIFA